MRASDPTPASHGLIDRHSKALGWMVLSGIGFTFMSLLVRRLAKAGMDQGTLVFFRSFINALLVLLIVAVRRKRVWPGSFKRVLAVRAVFGFLSLSCFFYGLSYLPLSIASLLNWSAPVFVLLFSRVFLRERPQSGFGLKVTVVVLGLLLVLSPQQQEGHWGEYPLHAVLIGVLGAAFAGGAYTAVRAATAKVSSDLIVLWFTGISSLLALPWFLRSSQGWPAVRELFELVLMGFFATVGQIAMTQGYRYAPASTVSSMGLMNACFFAVAGWWAFDETLSSIQLFGMLLTAAGVAWLGLPPRNKVRVPSSSLV